MQLTVQSNFQPTSIWLVRASRTHLCASLTPAQHHPFLSRLYVSVLYLSALCLSVLCLSRSTNSSCDQLQALCCVGAALPFVQSAFFLTLFTCFLLGTLIFLPGMETSNYLRPSVINSSYFCLFSYYTMANLEEQVTLGTKCTIVLKGKVREGQTCHHKGPQAHLARHLL